ncbi:MULTISPECIES: hypothetical protein [Bacillus]|uniref:hypothetical protein n=1 Tax=Bacillus TaxID=1386 RepID=UPI000BF9B688|nr:MULTISPECIES: hypothetical protein [Bacillus]MBY7112107.1 hypothetical protein [Bacillus sp. 17RED48]MCX3316186.1 hypothetical protein [Bacillus wiedmannii]MRS26421.1 hypothetical protein [Bacillus sp. RIT694]PGE66870.1 hypothetical protein COM69_18040 [Bacillus toyonensis]PHD40149.1 hypothetical protein COF65_19900 [Bacillus toyonensis]
MTTKAIATIRNIIEKDTIVQSNLSKYEGEPALTFQTAQKDMKMPYAVMRIESNNPDDIEVIDRMILTFDIYCGQGDYEKADVISRRIELLLDREAGLLRDSGIITIHRAGSVAVPDEDPSIIHISIKFLVRVGRMELY